MANPNLHGQPELERAHGNPGESVAVMGFKSSREGGEKQQTFQRENKRD